MKKYIILLNLFFIFNSCDIEEGPFINDYNSYINPDKKVLIEDFTGHRCPNCPNAAREMEAIHAIYGDQIIGMAIHVSSFAKPKLPNFTYDFRTQWGDELDLYYEISNAGLPKGMINRIGFENNAHKLGKDEWANAVALELKKDVDFKLSINSDSSSISITTEVLNDVANNYNIAVCITENNIINWQKDGQDDVEDYQHNHVLRSVITDESLSNSQNLFIGQEIEKIYTIDLANLEQYNIDYSQNNADDGNGNAGGWVIDNLSVIAYIYNITTKEIVQVEETYINN